MESSPTDGFSFENDINVENPESFVGRRPVVTCAQMA